jgi:RNA polymerase sigma-70 factor (ECF subfamily)
MLRRSFSHDFLDDQALLRAIAARDRHALETLYWRYAPRLGRYLSRLLGQRETVEEVLNDVMLVVSQKAATFDPSIASVSTWLFGIAHKKGLKALARSSRERAKVSLQDNEEELSVTRADLSASPPNHHEPERALMGRQIGEALEWALEQLSAEHRAVIELAFGEDCSYAEIAAIVECPVNTVKTRVFHARKRLAELLARRGVDAFAKNSKQE